MIETLKVAILGLSSSGKTTYLASMFRKLSVQSKDIGFYIDCDNETQRQELNELYRKLLIPEEEIPKTQVADKIVIRPFTFYVRNGNAKFPALRIEYADYAGEFLNVSTVDNSAFISYLRSADVVLVMISGKKIYEYLSQESLVGLDDEITNIIQLLNDYALGEHPVHFLITMWDLFENTDAQLKKIKDTLLEFPMFQSFLERAQETNLRVRLIPVSSYGFNFAELKDGQMQKILGGKPNPVYMEVPLVCTFRDSFEQLLKNAKEEMIRLAHMPKPIVQIKFGWGDFLKDLLASIAKLGLRFIRGVLPKSFDNISDEYLLLAIENLEKGEQRRKDRRQEELQAEYERLLLAQQKALKLVADEATAKESVLRSCDKIILRLEEQFPSSLVEITEE